MKARAGFLICGLVAAVVTLFSVALVRAPNRSSPRDVTIQLSGYTNGWKGCMAVFLLTNRTSSGFSYEVGNWISDAFETVKFTGAGSVGNLRPYGAFTFAVPVPPGTNEWHVVVETWEVGKPYWSLSRGYRGAVARRLKALGIYDADPKSYSLTSPGFSRPSTLD